MRSFTFNKFFPKLKVLPEKIGVSLILPRQCSRQKNPSNFCNPAMEEYYRLSIFIPYLDSLISSLQIRFSPETRFTFSLCALHSSYLLHHTEEEYFYEIDQICKHYEIDDFKAEAATWFELWSIPKIARKVNYSGRTRKLIK